MGLNVTFQVSRRGVSEEEGKHGVKGEVACCRLVIIDCSCIKFKDSVCARICGFSA